MSDKPDDKSSSAWYSHDSENVTLDDVSDEENKNVPSENDDSSEEENTTTSDNEEDDDVLPKDTSEEENNISVGEGEEATDPTTSCCNSKGFANTLARGFCRAVNAFISCIKEKLTSRQMFLLVGALIAAIFKTKNVAMDVTPAKDGTEGSEAKDEDNTAAAIITEAVIESALSFEARAEEKDQ